VFGWTKKEKKEVEVIETQHLTSDEQITVAKILSDFENASATRQDECEDTGNSIEQNWEDEHNLWKGGGLQWYTTITNPSKRIRRNRPNSENNFIFSALTVQHANVTRDTPDVIICGVDEDDEEMAKKLTDASRFNDEKNEFMTVWKKWVMDFISSGPAIAKVCWDDNWIGGKGPDRWVGDVRLLRCDKWDMYFDPAITDLETDDSLQQCSYIIRRVRKKLKYISSRWDVGSSVGEELNEDESINEGADPQQAYVIEYWHRGYPMHMPTERAKELRDKAIELEGNNEVYKARDYYDSANGTLEGIHVAYVANGVLLEYCPYEYEHGKYPFVFTTRFSDDKNQWGFGEIRNIKIPQIMHNKADEIEIEAMSREGLGGMYYQKGSINAKQKDKIVENSGKGGMMFEVDDVSRMKDRTGVTVPASVTNYKEHKQRMVESISGNTDIMQGQSPGAGVPFASLQQLGARADVRMGSITGKLEDFLVKINKLRIELFSQFYTEERYYRIRDNDNKVIQGNIRNDDIMKQYTREIGITEQGESIEMIEKFVPEFDVSVRIISEKPTDRNYYTNLALQLYQMQLLEPEDLLTTLEDGKMPPINNIIEKIKEKQAMAMQQQPQQPINGGM
jgi:hypothetical protein